MKNKGFTLMELLIVIAIIGILAATITVGVTTARRRSIDGRIQEEVANFRGAAELFYNEHGRTYETVCDTTNAVTGEIRTDVNDLADFRRVTCDDAPQRFVFAARLVGDNGHCWCVDETGASREIDNGQRINADGSPKINATTGCPATLP